MKFSENLLAIPINRIFGKCRELRIAIVGTQASGKTVFLTSLINHMEYHDREKMRLGDYEIIKFKELNAEMPGFSQFPYNFYRSELVKKSNWPSKTSDSSLYRCDITLKNSKKEKKTGYRLVFLDYPGERTADFHMISDSYEEWSDAVLKMIEEDTQYRDAACACGFVKAICDSANEEQILRTYKTFLGHAIVNHYSRMVTPSVFLLDSKGTRPDAGGTPESWAEERYCGLNVQEQFAPLSSGARLNNKSVADKFAQRYQRYRLQVVVPLVKWLSEADQLFVLEDVAEVLMSGPSRYNDECSIAERVLAICDRDGGFTGFALDLLKVGILGGLVFWPAHIQRVGIVATKTDSIWPDDIDNVESLVKQMTYKKLRGVNVGKAGYFTCAAVKSTAKGQKENTLRGRPVYDQNGNLIPNEKSEVGELNVSSVPREWPYDEEWRNFNFPAVYPRVSKQKDTPPAQEGLERILTFILGLGEK